MNKSSHIAMICFLLNILSLNTAIADNAQYNKDLAYDMARLSACTYKLSQLDGNAKAKQCVSAISEIKFLNGQILAERGGIDAFILAKKGNNTGVIAFRGTLPLIMLDKKEFEALKNDQNERFNLAITTMDWLNDLDKKPNPDSIHYGFSESWNSNKQLLDGLRIEGFKEFDNISELIFTGHSKGGSVAQVAAHDTVKPGTKFVLSGSEISKVTVMSFEAARVFTGDMLRKYQQQIDSGKLTHFRFEYGNDVVPQVPLRYQSVGQGIYLQKETNDEAIPGSVPTSSLLEVLNNFSTIFTALNEFKANNPISVIKELKEKNTLHSLLGVKGFNSKISDAINDHDINHWCAYFTKAPGRTCSDSNLISRNP